jgi:hypothetical protein
MVFDRNNSLMSYHEKLHKNKTYVKSEEKIKIKSESETDKQAHTNRSQFDFQPISSQGWKILLSQ